MAVFQMSFHFTVSNQPDPDPFRTFQSWFASGMTASQTLPSWFPPQPTDSTTSDIEIELIFDPGDYELCSNPWGCQFRNYVNDHYNYLNFTKITLRGLGDTTPGGQNRARLKISATTDLRDDAFINICGKVGKEVEVVIENLDIKTEVSASEAVTIPKNGDENNGYLRRDVLLDAYYIVKVSTASSVLVENVGIHCENLPCTCLDMRWCHNVTVRNCVFVNRNRRLLGGCLWFRGYADNVLITDNEFYKCGNDEIIAIWTDNTINVDTCKLQSGYTSDYVEQDVGMENIRIVKNKIVVEADNSTGPIDIAAYNAARATYRQQHSDCTTHDEAPWGGVMDVPLAVYTAELCQIVQNRSGAKFLTYNVVDNIIIADNTITTNAPVFMLIRLSFNCRTEASGIKILRNTITHNNWVRKQSQLIDFCASRTAGIVHEPNDVINESFDVTNWQTADDIVLTDNVINSRCLAYIQYNSTEGQEIPFNDEEHYFIMANGVNILARANTFKRISIPGGVQLTRAGAVAVLCQAYGARLMCHRNLFQTLYCFGIVHGQQAGPTVADNISELKVIATENDIHGDTFISLANVAAMGLYYMHNMLNTCNKFFEFLFIGSVDTGTIVFEDNHLIYLGSLNGDPLMTNANTAANLTSLSLLAKHNVYHNMSADHNPYDNLWPTPPQPGIAALVTGDQHI